MPGRYWPSSMRVSFPSLLFLIPSSSHLIESRTLQIELYFSFRRRCDGIKFRLCSVCSVIAELDHWDLKGTLETQWPCLWNKSSPDEKQLTECWIRWRLQDWNAGFCSGIWNDCGRATCTARSMGLEAVELSEEETYVDSPVWVEVEVRAGDKSRRGFVAWEEKRLGTELLAYHLSEEGRHGQRKRCLSRMPTRRSWGFRRWRRGSGDRNYTMFLRGSGKGADAKEKSRTISRE